MTTLRDLRGIAAEAGQLGKCRWCGSYSRAPCQCDAEVEIERLAALADSEGSRAVEYLRRARKAEAALRALADAADDVGVKHFDSDWLTDEAQRLKNATLAARALLRREG